MKKLFYLFLLFSTLLFAQNNVTIEKFMILKSLEKGLTLKNIEQKKELFKPIGVENNLISTDSDSWVKITLNRNLPSGKYLLSYQGFEFDINSFKKDQTLTSYISNVTQVFSFEYQKNRDAIEYYFKLLPVKHYAKPYFKIELFDTYYKEALLKPDGRGFFLFFGLIVGLMFMVIIYNLSIYFYTQNLSFLYYSLMEIFMILVMIYQFGISSLNVMLYNSATLLSSLFGTLFIRIFLDTQKYLPKLDQGLQLYVLLLSFDLIHLYVRDYSLFSFFGLYAIFGIFYFIVAFARLKQGFTPAKFFLMGWFFLVLSIFMTEHIGSIYGFSPFLFGPPLEAIFLAIALAYKLKLSLDEKKEQQELLVHQSKLASMGEMIGNISHQWKQPLTYLSFNFMNLREADKRNLLDSTYLNKKLNKADAQLKFMSDTIDNFKNFYLPNKEKELFSVYEASLETLEIMSCQFEQYQIKIVLNVEKDTRLNAYKNEYKQVLLNLLTNAKDIFLQRKTLHPKITVTFCQNLVMVADNAGGIPNKILRKIYDPYFTTKKGNSGIGLYMSKMIIEKNMKGRLDVENIEEGALFKIIF
jgi:signal transduction histidine kinase